MNIHNKQTKVYLQPKMFHFCGNTEELFVTKYKIKKQWTQSILHVNKYLYIFIQGFFFLFSFPFKKYVQPSFTITETVYHMFN